MSEKLYYVSNGRMYRCTENKPIEVNSWVLDSYITKVRSRAEQNEWKYNGNGAAFTGNYMEQKNASDSVSSIYSRINCLGMHRGDLLYSIDIDSTCGIYRKSPNVDSEGIVLCNASNAYRDFAIRDEKLVCSVHFAGESHIGVLDLNTKAFNTYTEGHCLDSSPAWSKTDPCKIYYSSAGLPENDQRAPETDDRPRGISQLVDEMYSSENTDLRGPASICLLDTSLGTLDEILSDPHYDFTHPACANNGDVYYIKKPYRTTNGRSSLGCIADIFMFPIRLVGAIFGFLNVFSATYSGKTLSRSNVKRRDERQMLIDGNLINAEKELKQNQRRGDKNPGIIPGSWELRRLGADGTDTLVRKGVSTFCLTDDGSEIYVSNGSSILKIDKNGREEKILSADAVSYITLCDF